jgi:GNAT superfamily N-acetyltransferase
VEVYPCDRRVVVDTTLVRSEPGGDVVRTCRNNRTSPSGGTNAPVSSPGLELIRMTTALTRTVPEMVTIRTAQQRDLDELVHLESALFAVDAVVHEPLADVTWPDREPRQDFEALLANDRCVVFVAEDRAGTIVGHLVGYLATSSPTRLPATYAVLRSMYVRPADQRHGVGSTLVDSFVAWARDHSCAEAHVDAYVANHRAGEFYESLGFVPRTVSRILEL